MHKCVYTHDLKLLVQCASTSLDTKISTRVPNIRMSACLARAWKVATAVDLHMDLVRQLYVYCTIELKKVYLSMDLVRF